MNEAENTVKEHLAKDGEEKTTVHKNVLPAVEHENVQREQTNKEHVAIDRERHQDHFQTKVQPLQDKEVLAEQHHHVDEGTEERVFRHGDAQDAPRRRAAEAAELGVHEDKRTVREAAPAAAAAGAIAEGEHVHHHVHENIQPVIQKETVEPHVVHRTKAIREVHQLAPQHHGAEQLPPVSIGEFQRQGGTLDGSAPERVAAYDGAPDGAEGYSAPSTRGTPRAAAAASAAPGAEADDEPEAGKKEPGLLKKIVMGAGL